MAAEIVEAAKLNETGKVAEANWEAGGRGGSSEADDALHGLRMCVEEKCLQNRVKPRL